MGNLRLFSDLSPPLCCAFKIRKSSHHASPEYPSISPFHNLIPPDYTGSSASIYPCTFCCRSPLKSQSCCSVQPQSPPSVFCAPMCSNPHETLASSVALSSLLMPSLVRAIIPSPCKLFLTLLSLRCLHPSGRGVMRNWRFNGPTIYDQRHSSRAPRNIIKNLGTNCAF